MRPEQAFVACESVFLFIYQKVYCVEWKLRICIYQNQAYLQDKGNHHESKISRTEKRSFSIAW
jgi:hypothetical protein